MRLFRRLRPELIKLELETIPPPESDPPLSREKYLWTIKEGVIRELAQLMNASGRVGNVNKLYLDLLNREKKASTGLVRGIAIPHVRTIEAREFLLGFARSTTGLEFDSMDGEPARLFFVIVAPPYDDREYLKTYKKMATAFETTEVLSDFMDAREPGEIIRAMRSIDD